MIKLGGFKRGGVKLFGHMLLPVVLAMLTAAAYEHNTLQALDVLLYDSAQRLRPATTLSNSVVIAIDEQSIAQLGRWPWSRAQHAELINQLTDDGVKAVIFDVLFADVSDPAEDRALASAFKQHGRVVLPMSIEPLSSSGQLVEVLPTAALFDAAHAVGHAHIDCDYDGVCRSFYVREGLGEAAWSHLSAALLPASQPLPGARAGVQATSSPLWIYRNYHNYIPFSPRDSVPIVSYVDVLAGQLPAHYLKGKTAFIGATAAGVHDILTTPVGRMPGVEITAFIHHHLQAGTLVQRMSGTAVALCIGVVVALMLSGLSLLAPRPFLLMTLLCIAVQCGLAFVLLIGVHRWLAIAPVIVVTLVFYPLWSWLRLELAMAYLKRSLTLRQQHPPLVSGLLNTLQPTMPSTSWLMGGDTVARTVSQLDVASAAQEAAHQLLQQSVSGLQEGCIIFDNNGQCYLTNALAVEWLPGWESGDINDLGRYLSLPIVDWPAAVADVFSTQNLIQCEAKSIPGMACVERLAEGEAIYFVQVKSCPIQLPNRSSVVVGVLTLTDISALKASERAREETLNFISHDLRSPLVSILSLITHQREVGSNATNSPALLNQIERYANRNLAYSESLLQLNRAEHLVPAAQTGMCDLLAVCEDAYAQVLPFAQAQDCLLQQECDDEEYWITGDYELLQRVVVNLLTNAIKYGASSKGVILQLSRLESASPEDIHDVKAQLSVQDFGAGMTREQQAQAFERFSRNALPASSGAGLGLFFIKTVITKHGGNVALKTEPNAGCRVTCTLPLQALDFLADSTL